MEILSSTFIAAAMIGTLLVLGLRRGLWMFFAMMPLGAAAAFNMPAVGNASFGIKELAVIAVFGMVFLRPGGPDSVIGTVRPGQPGCIALVLFVWCILSAFWVPAVFRGATEVFTISRSANANGIRSIPLGPTTGNLTQLFTLSISLAAFLTLATFSRLNPDPRQIDRAIAVATGLNLALGLLDLLSAAGGFEIVMEPLRTANYTILWEARMMGLKRMIGAFPEASSFGSFSMGLFGFWLHRYLVEPKSRLALVMLLIALFCLLRSTSSAAYVGLVLFVAVYVAYGSATRMRSVLQRQVVVTAIIGALLLWHAVILVYASYELVEPVAAFLNETVFEKLGTDSGVERMSWNAQALRNLTDTWLIGAGLGSARASNWLLSTLGSLGVPGTLLFIGFLASVFAMRVRGGRGSEAQMTVSALKWGCAATLATELLIASTPNLGVFFFAMAGLATGLARSTAAEPGRYTPVPRGHPA
ncbi:O-antigen ligase family protein [Oceaniglobus roseus]|uniref:O-antigen ligase family protein n=1 Tax=Oceaniglobus roseus TaxID=1737570 RepID=UPI0012FFFC33|nr:hypothetical protein [Kandeliimicrobium roseum]